MSSWLEEFQPRVFSDLAFSSQAIDGLTSLSIKANPPHLLICGPVGIGKTAAWRLVARQVLGPSWKSTTHVLQARDLARKAGAMAKFEEFLRPSGNDSSDTLAGTMSLDAFDSSFTIAESGDVPPAGQESHELHGQERSPVARLIIIEDADHLGHRRQAYLRRMMEHSSNTSRFIFTARAPSRVIDALRSRMRIIRLPATDRKQIKQKIDEIFNSLNIETARGVSGDIAHIANGNLRKGVFVSEVLANRNMVNDRNNVHELVKATSMDDASRVIEEALRGRVNEFRWEQQGQRNVRVLKGAMGVLDEMMTRNSLDDEDVVLHLHEAIVNSRSNFEDAILSKLLEKLSILDVSLRKSNIGRIQIERFLYSVAKIGKELGYSQAQFS